MNVESYDLDSLRKIIRKLQQANAIYDAGNYLDTFVFIFLSCIAGKKLNFKNS